MEFPRAVVINIGPKKDPPHPFSSHMVADIVVIDETSNVMQPLLWRLKKTVSDQHDLYGIPKDIVSFQDEDLFTVLGSVIHIDKVHKIITLKNRNTIAYKHLILASGSRTGGGGVSQHDFVHGLHALIDAMRLRVTLPQTSPVTRKKHPKLTADHTHFHHLGVKETVSSMSVKRVASPMMSGVEGKFSSISDLNAIEKPLYVVTLDTQSINR